MAKRRRHMGGIVGINLGEFVPNKNDSTKVEDVAVGALIGAGAGLAARALYNQLPATTQAMIPAQLSYYSEEIGAVVSGVAAFALQKKSNRAKAVGHAAGAIAYGLASAINSFARDQAPTMFSGVVSVNLGNGNYGLLVDAPPSALNGLIVSDTPAGFQGLNGHNSMGNLAQLAAASLGDDGDDDDGGLSALAQM